MSATATPATRVVIRDDGDGFVLTVEPHDELIGGPHRFATYREARGFAGGIRMTRSFPIDDQSSVAKEGKRNG